MDAELWKQLVPQAPAAVAVIAVVILFLKHLAAEKKADREMNASASSAVKGIVESCHTNTREMRHAFQEQIIEMEKRDEDRRRELAAQYDRDRRETNEFLARVSSALASNGETLKSINNALQDPNNPMRRRGDWEVRSPAAAEV